MLHVETVLNSKEILLDKWRLKIEENQKKINALDTRDNTQYFELMNQTVAILDCCTDLINELNGICEGADS